MPYAVKLSNPCEIVPTILKRCISSCENQAKIFSLIIRYAISNQARKPCLVISACPFDLNDLDLQRCRG
ncbi:uncharacterized protein RAG0_17260 [Rhynchosporium agropyri]|uniref:Uncharacterized protein n=1 Tax=Rhynchosporium agropyri TaxID=914238 RepID=A0A1E1LTD4_9HELO|nr:uncharacterized protein RAG0_17260 [Rhynchosporium agropyri]